MVDHPCIGADSTLRVHICQVALKQRRKTGWPLPSSQVSLPTANGDSKNRTPESGNDPSAQHTLPFYTPKEHLSLR